MATLLIFFYPIIIAVLALISFRWIKNKPPQTPFIYLKTATAWALLLSTASIPFLYSAFIAWLIYMAVLLLGFVTCKLSQKSINFLNYKISEFFIIYLLMIAISFAIWFLPVLFPMLLKH